MNLKKTGIPIILATLFLSGCSHIKEDWRFNQYPRRASTWISGKYLSGEECVKTPFEVRVKFNRIIDFDAEKVANSYLKTPIKVIIIPTISNRYGNFSKGKIIIWNPMYSVFLHELAHAIAYEKYGIMDHNTQFCEVLDGLYSEWQKR